MILQKQHANKVINIENSLMVTIPDEEFSQGDALILFNNKDEYITIKCDVPNTYRSGFQKTFSFIECPPRCMVNAIFIDSKTVVFTKGLG
jgi:hypothetical protein